MIIFFLILAIITAWGIRFSSFNEGYISLQSTNAIKGVFAVIILFSHMNGYIVLQDSIYDTLFESILRHLGQLMVAPFLFFSGYGIMESVKRKPGYSSSFPKKRILRTLIHFDIAVLTYLIMGFVLGYRYPLSYYLTSWIGWESLGNSNWFVFVILLLYVLAYVSIIFAEKICVRQEKGKRFVIVSSTLFLSAVAWVALRLAGKDSWWYDTVITFPLGMCFSFVRSRFETIMRMNLVSWVFLIALVIAMLAWHLLIGNDVYGICAGIFCIVVVAVSTKVHIGNRVLSWLGAYSFAIYIMQRLPMNLFDYFGWSIAPYLFSIISIPTVLVTAWIYDSLLSVVDTKLDL